MIENRSEQEAQYSTHAQSIKKKQKTLKRQKSADQRPENEVEVVRN